MHYDGWELEHFDTAHNFRKYQFELISKYIKNYTAEVGPGTGKNIKFYLDNVKKLDLFEPSKNLSKILSININLQKKIKIINKLFCKSKNKYDAILYLDVLEHIKNDKYEVYKSFHSLKKNGYLIINVPAFQFLYSKFDKDIGHFRRYNKSSIRKLLKDIKYKKISFKYYDSLGFLLSLFSKILGGNYKKNFRIKIMIWNFLIPLSKIIDKLTFNFFGKSLVVIIKK